MIQIDTNDKIFYVYFHKNSSTGEVFYVGKGTGLRYTSSHGRNKFWKNYTKKNNWTSEIVFNNLTEDEAYDIEASEIERIGRRINRRGPLLNILPGGRSFPETYAIYREELLSELSDTDDEVSKKEIAKQNRKELFELAMKCIDNSRAVKGSMEFSINEFSKKMGYVEVDTGWWPDLSEEERLNLILEEHRTFIHNFKVGRPWSKSIKEPESISDLKPEFIKKMYNLKEEKYKSIKKIWDYEK